MVRPRKVKTVNFQPEITYFKPRAVPLSELQEVELTIDELETLRLSNLDKLNQSESADSMGIHQSTFQRTLTRATEKITDALVNGKAIKILGGNYTFVDENTGGNRMARGDMTGPEGKGPKTGRGLGLCSGSTEPGYKNTTAEKRNGGRGQGLGKGRRQSNND